MSVTYIGAVVQPIKKSDVANRGHGSRMIACRSDPWIAHMHIDGIVGDPADTVVRAIRWVAPNQPQVPIGSTRFSLIQPRAPM